MIDLFPDMALETRAYLLLGLIGVIFFAGVLALGVGNAVNNLKKANEYNDTDTHAAAKPKPTSQKKVKPEKPKREKKPVFKKKKKEDAIEVMAIPAGYEAPVEESEPEDEEIVFTPSGFGETIDEDLPDDWLSGGDEDDEDIDFADDDDSDWNVAPASNSSDETEQQKTSRSTNANSPFGGGIDVDF